MTVANWEELIKERLRAYDPTIDTSTGSAAQKHVVSPLVSRLSPGFIETAVREFVLTRLRQEHPNLAYQDGSALNDVLIGPMISILDGVKREILDVERSRDLSNPDTLTTSDVDAILENLFFTRDQGAYASVRVRAYFQNPLSVVIGSANTAYTASSLRFIPSAPVRFPTTQVLLNRDSATGYYYVDVTFRAERPGAAYNVTKGEIVGITGLSAAVYVTNLADAVPGRDPMSNSQFVNAARQGIGERSLNTEAGIIANVKLDQFPGIDILQVIGFNDPEMNRDILTGGSMGAILHQGLDVLTNDDGDVDGYTPLIEFASFAATTSFGPVGTDLSGYVITLYAGGVFTDYTLKQVEGTNSVSIADTYTGTARPTDALAAAPWTIRKGDVITLSDIPGGILFPSSDGTTVEVPEGSIHLGSCTDIYLRGPTRETKALSLSLVADQEGLQYGELGSVSTGSSVVTLADMTAANAALIAASPGKYTLYLETAPGGAYRIIEQETATQYRVDNEFAGPATNISWVLVDDVDIDLVTPKERRWVGADLKTIAGIATVETLGADPDFLAIGVAVGDYLKILNGDDAGEYEIASRTSSSVTLTAVMNNTASPLNFQIYRKQGGIDLPLVRVTKVELLDGDLEPTGDVLPYRHPIDAQSKSFQNPGRGARAGTDASVTGDTLSFISAYVVESSDVTMDFYSQGLRAGDILNVNDSDNQGYYVISVVGGDPGGALSASPRRLQLETALSWNVSGMEYAAGPPSYGSFRLYFMDPTSFEMTASSSRITITDDLGFSRTFRPDPEVFDQFLPSDVTKPTCIFGVGDDFVDTFTADGAIFDNVLHGVEVGDRLRATYAPLVSSINCSSTAPGAGPFTTIDGATLLIDVGSGSERVTFSGTSLTADDVVEQINNQLSKSAATKWENPSVASSEYVALRGDYSISILDNSGGSYVDATADVFGARATFNPWLAGNFVANTTTNVSPVTGYYAVTDVDDDSITLDTWPSGAWTATDTVTETTLGHYFRVERPGRQRVSSTDMLSYQDEHDLYYFDVECVSTGHGEPWNIDADLQGVVTGYESEGWATRTDDEDTSFSMAETPWIDVTNRVLIAGDQDDVTNHQEIVGQSIQVTYERDDVVEQVHDYVREPSVRVSCNNPLAKSLLPVFVRTNIEFEGGGTESVLRDQIITLIKSILPRNELEVSDVEAVITRSGASDVTHPITLVGVAWQKDRSLIVERSVDAISSSRLYGLLPDTDDDGDSLIKLSRQAVSQV